jgi:hypothetical protein
MIRKALLIGAPGPKEKYLNGVSVDMGNFKNYLLSDTGGFWFDSEIMSVVNPSPSELGAKLDQLKKVDYSIVYFSGHGGISKLNNRYYIEINSSGDDFDVSSLKELSDRELIIIDSCRGYYTPMEKARGDRAIFSVMNTRNRYRERYESILQKCEYGTVSLYAANFGEAANEDSLGGYFTQGLFRSVGSEFFDCLNVNEAFNLAKEFVTTKTRYQTPQKDGSIRRNNWFPFALK